MASPMGQLVEGCPVVVQRIAEQIEARHVDHVQRWNIEALLRVGLDVICAGGGDEVVGPLEALSFRHLWRAVVWQGTLRLVDLVPVIDPERAGLHVGTWLAVFFLSLPALFRMDGLEPVDEHRGLAVLVGPDLGAGDIAVCLFALFVDVGLAGLELAELLDGDPFAGSEPAVAAGNPAHQDVDPSVGLPGGQVVGHAGNIDAEVLAFAKAGLPRHDVVFFDGPDDGVRQFLVKIERLLGGFAFCHSGGLLVLW